MKKLTKRQIIILASLLVVFVGLIIGVILLAPKTKEKNPKKPIEAKVEVKREIELEVYTKLPSLEDFTEEEGSLNLDAVPSEDTVCPEEETDCVVEKLATTVGSYEVVITIKDKEYKSTLKVIDSTKPTLKTKDVSITEGETYTVDSFIEEKSDNSKKEVKAYFEDENMANIKEVGEHIIKIVAEDESGNSTKAETKLIINKKEEVTTNNNSSSSSSSSSGSITPVPSPTPSAPAVQECTINGPYTGLYANGTRDADLAKLKEETVRVVNFMTSSDVNRSRWGQGSGTSKGPETVVYDSCGKAVGYIMRVRAWYRTIGEGYMDENNNFVETVPSVTYEMEYYLDHNGNWVVTSNPHNIAWR